MVIEEDLNFVDKEGLRLSTLEALKQASVLLAQHFSTGGLTRFQEVRLSEDQAIKLKKLVNEAKRWQINFYDTPELFEQKINEKAAEYAAGAQGIDQFDSQRHYFSALNNIADQSRAVRRLFLEVGGQLDGLATSDGLKKVSGVDCQAKIIDYATDFWKRRTFQLSPEAEQPAVSTEKVCVVTEPVVRIIDEVQQEPVTDGVDLIEDNATPSGDNDDGKLYDLAAEDLNKTRLEYAMVRQESRSVRHYLLGLFKKSDKKQRLIQTRQRYESSRDKLLSLKFNKNYTNASRDNTFKTSLAENLAETLVDEMVYLNQFEVGLNNKENILNQVVRVSRNPLLRMATGFGLNIGLGVAFATANMPLAAVVYMARVGFGTIGFEGYLSGGGRLINRFNNSLLDDKLNNLLLRSELAPDLITDKIASLYEEKIESGDKETSPYENNLLGCFSNQLSRNLRYRLFAKNSEDLEPSAIQQALKDLLLLSVQDEKIYKNNRNSLIKWSLAGAVSLALNSLINFSRFESIFSPASPATPSTTPTPDLGKTGTVFSTPVPTEQVVSPQEVENLFNSEVVKYKFEGDDGYYERVINNANISSVEGRIQYFLARDYYKIPNFDIHNPEHIKEFFKRLGEDPKGLEKVKEAMRVYREINPQNAFQVFIDGKLNNSLLQHKDAANLFINFRELNNWHDFFVGNPVNGSGIK